MKIVHIVESFAGGVFDFLVDLTSGMPENEFIIIYGEREHTPENFEKYFPQGTQFFAWKDATREINPKKDILAFIQIVKLLKPLNNVDVIHLHSSKAGFLGRVAARILWVQKKVLYTPHGVSFLRKDVSPTKHKVFIFLEKIGAWFGGRVVACSKSESEAFHEYGIESNYVNNGIKCDLSFQVNKKTDCEKITIGTIGRITYPKNPTLFHEIAQSFSTNKSIEFLWIGGGELKEELSADNINVTGWLSRDEVDQQLGKIDIFLSTSLWEGLPLSVLQAMCAAKPLVLSNCVGNKDLVKESINGVLFDEKTDAVKALNDMIENLDRVEVFGLHSQELVQKEFSIDQMIEGYLSLYQSC
ncbi:glycosyl transferase [Sulfurovum sp. TSL6]|uniref:glycosyltransferase n=1 Tax=Sulfurovum sp. TSL6 TaxID=2826995 RepID=UPI001CC5EB5B|nr:glycosyltransferase [Sulfurovum sp. TSL6]GIU00847.1 glycosyl transferase [Sulfurovum sp. TSL6]